MNSSIPAVKLINVTKKFGETTILDNINLEIPQNKIVTILGFSGAGKSTLLKHLLGLLFPTSGEVQVLGRSLAELSPVELREFRKNFGVLFQQGALFDYLTAFENVAFPLREFSLLTEEEIGEKVSQLLTQVNLAPRSFHLYPAELSGGMRKRVGLARSLALDPRIMLYDEPTTGLDPITTKMVNDLIVSTAERCQDRGLTSIIISHDVKASLAISDLVAFLGHGKIVEYLPANEFRQSSNPLVQEFINL